MSSLYEKYHLESVLHPEQRNCVEACLKQKRCIVQAKMGSGKTLMTLALISKVYALTEKPSIVCMEKNLLPTWMAEVAKWFPEDRDKFILLHSMKERKGLMDRGNLDGVVAVFTTPHLVMNQFKKSGSINFDVFNLQLESNRSFLTDMIYNEDQCAVSEFKSGPILASRWGLVVVDEVQRWYSYRAKTNFSVSCIRAEFRMVMSGTPLPEPSAVNLIGLANLIQKNRQFSDPGFFTTSSEGERHQWYHQYASMNLNQEAAKLFFRDTLIVVPDREQFEEGQELHMETITHEMTPMEVNVYTGFQTIAREVKALLQEPRYKDSYLKKKFGAFSMVVGMMLRQCIVCPVVPYASLIASIFEGRANREIIDIFNGVLRNPEIADYMNSDNTIYSSRIVRAMEQIDAVPKEEKVVCFFIFRRNLIMFKHVLDESGLSSRVPTFVISSNDTVSKRGSILADYNAFTGKAVLLLTFDIGSNGLNLQCANHVVIFNHWWNTSKLEQGIARCWRQGQMRDVHVYLLTSSTGIENNLLVKQNSKKKTTDMLLCLGSYEETETETEEHRQLPETLRLANIHSTSCDNNGEMGELIKLFGNM